QRAEPGQGRASVPEPRGEVRPRRGTGSPAVAGYRQGGAKRPAGGAAVRLEDRHQERVSDGGACGAGGAARLRGSRGGAAGEAGGAGGGAGGSAGGRGGNGAGGGGGGAGAGGRRGRGAGGGLGAR